MTTSHKNQAEFTATPSIASCPKYELSPTHGSSWLVNDTAVTIADQNTNREHDATDKVADNQA